MYKVELYKISHSPNLLYLMLVVIPVSLFLGVSISVQMNISEPDNLLNIAFLSSSAVLMLYITIFASLYVNRDYSSNNYRVLIGCGLSRFKIITTKYVIFWLVSSAIISIHAAITMAIPIFLNKVTIHMENIQTITLYYLIYTSIISVVFFLSIIGKTLIKSIMINLAFIILSSIAVSALSSTNFTPVIPLQSLQVISSIQGDTHIAIISSLLYILSTYIASCLVFFKQEL
ncbi:ABC-type transport system involved in multi-copper enzyme maturation permease subunit [Fontibacillus solani]|uniref:ABC-type transport system involved in multi-copper enzyme maturation permease subunit n=1 Tax=Fontibacillus solani TaxID=1572857 RepID=A0A7W3SY06_9BACL|nr:hypothetical protein [Fontibacillus solani]MBA9088302.1 ABC-type transport system involved in multi-copper enzyme maturation permease subunit [Fontibacillus solani]